MIINSIIQVNIGYIPGYNCGNKIRVPEGTLILFLTSWQASGTTCLYHPHHIGKGIEDFNK